MDRTAEFIEALRKTRFTGEPEPWLIDATNNFFEAHEPGTPPSPELLDGLKTLPIFGAGWLAILFGSAAERGGNLSVTGPALWDAFCARMEEFPPTVDEEVDMAELTEQQAELAEGITSLCQGLVAHLARMPEFANRVSADAAIRERIEFLQNYSHGFMWIDEVLSRKSGTVLLVHAESRRILELKYENVSNCFHLFSLLQGAVGTSLPGGKEPNSQLIAAARGQSYGELHDEAWWHYGHPGSAEPNVVASIFGEAPVASIPTLDGPAESPQQVMILWPPILQGRSWDAGFFGPSIEASPPAATIESELPVAEAASWLEFLGI